MAPPSAQTQTSAQPRSQRSVGPDMPGLFSTTRTLRHEVESLPSSARLAWVFSGLEAAVAEAEDEAEGKAEAEAAAAAAALAAAVAAVDPAADINAFLRFLPRYHARKACSFV